MAKGQKLPDRLKELILFELACNNNAAEVARTFGLPESTVKTLRLKHKDRYDELRRQKVEELIDESKAWKKDFIDQAKIQITKSLYLGNQKIELATAAMDGFQDQIDRLIELMQSRDDVNGRDVIDLIKALSSVTSIPLAQISTYLGTLYDKAALAGGEATSREEVNTANKLDFTKLSVEELKQLAELTRKATGNQ